MSAAGKTNKKLTNILKGSKLAIDFFKAEIMFVTPDNFENIAIKRNNQMLDTDLLNIKGKIINSRKKCGTVWVNIDKKLSFWRPYFLFMQKRNN